MDPWKTIQWPFLIVILSSPCILCHKADKSPQTFLQSTESIFLVAFTFDSIPYVSCIRSTDVKHSGDLTIRTVEYKQDKDNSGVWNWHSVDVSFTTPKDEETTSTLSITGITSLTKEYSAYLGNFPIVYESAQCLIFGDGYLNEHNKQRCMVWGLGKKYTSLPQDCQEKYQEKCIEGSKVDDDLLSDC
uniref:Putative secreted protein n=1 Tax=Amblyomma triste TaxID=251400 RepID=A0A023G493_AMBTT